MKKIKTYFSLFTIIAAIVMSSDMAIPSVYSVNYGEQVFAIQKDNMWTLGKNLSFGKGGPDGI